MKEKDLQTRFSRWLRHNASEYGSCAYELKITKGPSVAFASLASHQRLGLLAAKHAVGGLCFKIPDAGMGQKPFDQFCLVGGGAYVVVQFYARGVDWAYLVDIDAWVNLERVWERKSITEPELAGERGVTRITFAGRARVGF